jgi:hypothetical protein
VVRIAFIKRPRVKAGMDQGNRPGEIHHGTDTKWSDSLGSSDGSAHVPSPTGSLTK